MIPDLIVIGAGYSGLTAALRAAESGRRVLLLSKGLGTTHWAGGPLDVMGYYPVDSSTPVSSPDAALAQVMAADSQHPYARVKRADLMEAFAALQQAGAARGLTYVGGLDRNMMLPTPVGGLKPSAFAPKVMAAGEVKPGDKVLILSFNRLPDFFPALLAANLTVQGIEARGVGLDVPAIDKMKVMTTVLLAQLLDDPDTRKEAIRMAKAALGRETRVGFPAVLGFQRSAEVIADFERALGVPVFEIPTLPPSVTGYRLFNALRAHLESRGARIIIGSQVIASETSGGRATTIVTEAAGQRGVRYSAPDYILATGGIQGGGTLAEYGGKVREVVFDLPVMAPEAQTAWTDPRFLAPQGQPLYRSGVVVNDALQPLDAAGLVALQNVRVVGSALAHWDSWREKSHEGVCLATAWRAVGAL